MCGRRTKQKHYFLTLLQRTPVLLSYPLFGHNHNPQYTVRKVLVVLCRRRMRPSPHGSMVCNDFSAKYLKVSLWSMVVVIRDAGSRRLCEFELELLQSPKICRRRYGRWDV